MRILVVKLSSLGDLFHALPAVHALRAGLSAEVDWAVGDAYGDLVRCFTDVRRVIRFPRRRWVMGMGAFIRDLRAERYDLVVDLQGLLKSAFVTRLARARRRVGPSFHREGSALFYDAVAGPRDRARHAVEECLDVVRYLGLPPAPVEFPVRFPPSGITTERPRVAVLPGSRWPTKNWPVDRFIRALQLLRQSRDVSIHLIGGRDEVPACGQIAAALGARAQVVAGTLSLPQTGALLADMDLLISNDSGPVHMAAACGTRALVLFGPTDPLRTGPYGAGHRVLQSSLACRPCLSRSCRRGDLACMTALSPEDVARSAVEMLDAALKP